MLILVLNPGSSSLKYQLRRIGTSEAKPGILLDRVIDSPQGGALDPGFLGDVIDAAIRDITGGTSPDAIGHRVVHGGDRFNSPNRCHGGH